MVQADPIDGAARIYLSSGHPLTYQLTRANSPVFFFFVVPTSLSVGAGGQSSRSSELQRWRWSFIQKALSNERKRRSGNVLALLDKREKKKKKRDRRT